MFYMKVIVDTFRWKEGMKKGIGEGGGKEGGRETSVVN